ncbi:MAG: MBOAT family protein, partial [Planctomycetota bacterium]
DSESTEESIEPKGLQTNRLGISAVLFSSFEFLHFFLIAYGVYILLPHRRQNVWLLGASYVFYASWDPRFLALIVGSTIVDYFCGRKIEEGSPKEKRTFLCVSLVANLGALAFFKYSNFFIDSVSAALSQWGFDPLSFRLHVILPVGISFYTFQTMSYSIDIYRGELKATRNFIDFAVFVSFFPQLVAGPVERAKRFLPQVQSERRISYAMLRAGAWLILLGFFKKVAIADNLAPIVDRIFSRPEDVTSGLATLIGVYAFAFQIFCDFSGYSDIARGVAKLMGFDLVLNFRMPYFSKNPREFWTRWHISLSSWLRDYLYIPLGGSRGSSWLTARNLMITMALGGLWHGAAWHFVAWGVFHGTILIVHRALEKPLAVLTPQSPRARRVWDLACIVGFFHISCVGWIFFRVTDLSHVGILLGKVASPSLFLELDTRVVLWSLWLAFLVLPLLALQLAKERSQDMLVVKSWGPAKRLAVYLVLVAYIALCGATDGREFIYFQF